jgi:serine/threonine/tyrosine-interacting protein
VLSWVGAASVNEANILGITHILSILTPAEFAQYGPDESKDVELWHLEVKDEEASDILQYFPKGCDWIDKALSNSGVVGSQSGVIVHCQQGISRSPAFVVAYCMSSRDRFRPC